MQRIMVIGVSAGAGKSTFARRLGKCLEIPVHHLDTFYWKPNWVEADAEEFADKQKQAADQEAWIIEGNYTGTFPIRTERADTIIYLELPLIVCLYRVVKRRIMNNGKTRPDMGTECMEKLDWAFIKFILTTYSLRKKKMKERLKDFSETKQVIMLHDKKEIESFLNRLKVEKNKAKTDGAE